MAFLIDFVIQNNIIKVQGYRGNMPLKIIQRIFFKTDFMSDAYSENIDGVLSKLQLEDEIDFRDEGSHPAEQESEEVEDTSEEQSGDETKEDESKETESDESKEEESGDKNVPFHKHPRFQQMKQQNKDLLKRIEDYERKEQESAFKELSKEELENMTPDEILQYANNKYKIEQQQEKQASEKAEQYINETIQEFKDDGKDFDENELLSIAVEYTDGDLYKAMSLYERMNQKTQVEVKEKIKNQKRLEKSEEIGSKKGNTSSNNSVYRPGMGFGDIVTARLGQ